MTVLTVGQLRDRIDTPADDAAVQAILDHIEADITRRIGGPYVDDSTTIQEEFDNPGGTKLFVQRRISSVGTITEYRLISTGWDAGTELTAGTDYLVWPDKGMIERRGGWGLRVVVDYVPADDRELWREAELDLARLALSRSALKQESVGGEYSFTAPDNWEVEKARVMRRLMWPSL